MDALTKVKKAVVGLSLLTLAIGLGCGKKGGGGVVATPPSTNNDTTGCAENPENCKYGEESDYGHYLGTGIGTAGYGSGIGAKIKLAFFATDAEGLYGYNDDDDDDDIITYRGDVVAAGIFIVDDDDSYANIGSGVLMLSQREIAGVNWSIDFGINLGGNNQNNYNNYHDDYYYVAPTPIYYVPPKPTCYSGCTSGCNNGCNNNCYNGRCNTGCSQSNNYCGTGGCNSGNNYCDGYDTRGTGDYDSRGGDYDNINSKCRLPKGSYTVETLSDGHGTWNGRESSRYARVTNLKLKITGDDYEANALLTNAYVDSNSPKKSSTGKAYKLKGTLILQKVNDKSCNTRIAF